MLNTARKIRWNIIFATGFTWIFIFAVITGFEELRGIIAPLLLTLAATGALTIGRGRVNRLALPVLGFWLALLVTSIFSIEAVRSIYWAALIGGGLLAAAATTEISREAKISQTIISGLLISGGIAGLYFYGSAINWYADWLQAYPGEWLPWLSYRLPRSNLTAAYMAGCALLATGMALKTDKGGARIGLWLYAALAVGLIFLASSRGALAGLAAAGAVWLIVERAAWQRWLAPVLAWFRPRKALGYGLVGLLAAAAGGIGWLLLNVMAGHPTHGGAVLNARSLFWGVGWQMFVESPVWGNGLYTFSAFFMKAISVPPWDIFLHPHFMHLDVMSSSGLIGGAAYVWLLVAVFRGLARARKAAPEKSQGVVLGVTLMLASYLGHGVFDAMYHMPSASINLALALGAALAFDPPVKRKISRWTLAVLGLGVCVLAWGAAAVRAPAIRAAVLAESGDWSTAGMELDKAISLVPSSPLYQSEAGMMAAELAWQGETGALLKAVEYFEEAVRLDPTVAAHHLNLGALYRSQGRLRDALMEFETAADLAPNWDLAALQVGLAAEELGNSDQALRAYWKALTLLPELVNDSFWRVSPLRLQAVQLLRVSAGTGELGDPPTDETIIRQSRAGPIVGRALEAMQAGDLARAESLVRAAELAYRSKGLEEMELDWIKAELAAVNGDLIAASQLGTKAITGLELHGWQGAGTAGWALYDSGIYRMPDFKVELVPQVKVLRLFGAWPERMERLAEWQRLAGDPAGSEETLGLLESWQE